MATSTKSVGFTSLGSGGGSSVWSYLTNTSASDDNYTTVSGPDGWISRDLDCTNFGFSIPAGSTIDGIEVKIERYGSLVIDTSIKLLNGDGAGGESAQDKSTGASWSSTDTVDSFGGSTDTWGETWSVSDINSSDFGVRIQCQDAVASDSQIGSAQIDHVEIVIHYSPPERNSVSSLFVEVLGDESAPARNSVSSLFVEVLGDETADVQSISTNFGDIELKAVYLGDVQISKIKQGDTSIYN
jgi:hypothetical protein